MELILLRYLGDILRIRKNDGNLTRFIVPIVGLKWGTRVARFSSGISPTIGVRLIHELALQSALSN